MSTRSLVTAVVHDGSDCNAFVGPGFSYLAIALSSVVDVPWVDFSATSVELSDKRNNPSFSRVVPTDSIGGALAVSVLRAWNWLQISILCVDDSYGRSVASGVADALGAIGGVVEVSRCISATASTETVIQVVDVVLAARSRVLFVAMSPDTQAYSAFVTYLHRRNDPSLILVFNEGCCSSNEARYLSFPGSICASYSVNDLRMRPFYNSYLARNTSEELAELHTLGFDGVDTTSTSVFAAFAHDATYHIMSSIATQYATQNYSVSPIAYLRSHVTGGVTGDVVLDSNGDRVSCDSAVYNVLPNGTHRVIGHIRNGVFDLSERPFLLGDYKATIPSHLRPTEDKNMTQLITYVAIGAVFFIILVFTLYKLRRVGLERLKRLLKSGLVGTVLAILMRCSQATINVISGNTVAQSNSTITFKCFFLVLTAIACTVNVVEVVVLTLFFLFNLRTLGDFVEEELLQWRGRMAKVSVVAIGTKEIPMLIIALAAILMDEHDLFLILTMVVSAVLLGLTVDDVGAVWKAFLWSSKAKSRRFKTLRHAARFVMLVHRMSGSSAGLLTASKSLDLSSNYEEVQQAALFLRMSDPERYAVIENIARETRVLLQDQGATQNEYYAIVEPALRDRYSVVVQRACPFIAPKRPSTRSTPVVTVVESRAEPSQSFVEGDEQLNPIIGPSTSSSHTPTKSQNKRRGE